MGSSLGAWPPQLAVSRLTSACQSYGVDELCRQARSGGRHVVVVAQWDADGCSAVTQCAEGGGFAGAAGHQGAHPLEAALPLLQFSGRVHELLRQGGVEYAGAVAHPNDGAAAEGRIRLRRRAFDGEHLVIPAQQPGSVLACGSDGTDEALLFSAGEERGHLGRRGETLAFQQHRQSGRDAREVIDGTREESVPLLPDRQIEHTGRTGGHTPLHLAHGTDNRLSCAVSAEGKDLIRHRASGGKEANALSLPDA